MTVDQLYYFISVVEEDTFFSAAERCHITQSTLSKHIMKLETELDIRLLNRSRRSAVLTEAGEAFYREALVMAGQYEHMLTSLHQYKHAAKKEVRIGALPILLQQDISKELTSLIHACPKYTILLDEAEEKQLLDGLEHKTYTHRASRNSSFYGAGEQQGCSIKYDLILARESLAAASGYTYVPFSEDELAVILPTAHPVAVAFLTRQICFPIEKLNSEALLLMHTHTSVCMCCLKLMEDFQLHPNSVRHARVETILSAVLLGEGIGLIPRKSLGAFRSDGVVAVPVTPAVSLNVVIAWNQKQKLSDAAQNVLKHFTSDSISLIG